MNTKPIVLEGGSLHGQVMHMLSRGVTDTVLTFVYPAKATYTLDPQRSSPIADVFVFTAPKPIVSKCTEDEMQRAMDVLDMAIDCGPQDAADLIAGGVIDVGVVLEGFATGEGLDRHRDRKLRNN